MDTSGQEIFSSYRSLLFSLAYQILGEIEEAEDIVQDTFESWLEKKDTVENHKAYLSRVAVNKAIDRTETLKKERALYRGTWLPVPLVSDGAAGLPEIQGTDILSYALLHTLEKLNPVERAILILRESFGYPFHEIASICNITEENCRQILHRSKEKLKLDKVKYDADQEKHEQLLSAFMQACHNEDAGQLMKLLTDDIVLYADGGGKLSAPLMPLHGPVPVIRFLVNTIHRVKNTIEVKFVLVNGAPGVRFIDKGTGKTDTVMTLKSSGSGQIEQLFFIRNPDKIFF